MKKDKDFDKVIEIMKDKFQWRGEVGEDMFSYTNELIKATKMLTLGLGIIRYLDEKYLTRTFRVRLPEIEDEMNITIATESLQYALRNTNQLEGDIDDLIYYYVDNSVIHLKPEVICRKHLDTPIEFICEIKK